MKGAIKTVTIDGKPFDIRKEGASLALECQSIFITLISKNNVSLDDELNIENGFDMMSNMTKDVVKRIKDVFIDCIVSPSMTSESFEELSSTVIPRLFIAVHGYQTKEAEDKKKEPSESTK